MTVKRKAPKSATAHRPGKFATVSIPPAPNEVFSTAMATFTQVPSSIANTEQIQREFMEYFSSAASRTNLDVKDGCRGLFATVDIHTGELISSIRSSDCITEWGARQSPIGQLVQATLFGLDSTQLAQQVQYSEDHTENHHRNIPILSQIRHDLLPTPYSILNQLRTVLLEPNGRVILSFGHILLFIVLMYHRFVGDPSDNISSCFPPCVAATPSTTSSLSTTQSPSSPHTLPSLLTLYARWLPDEFSSPICWPRALMELTHFTSSSLFPATTRRIAQLHAIYHTIFPLLQTALPEVFPLHVFTFQRFVWAYSAYSSRSFPARFVMAKPIVDRVVILNLAVLTSNQPLLTEFIPCGVMLPFLDLTNHQNNHPVHWLSGPHAGSLTQRPTPLSLSSQLTASIPPPAATTVTSTVDNDEESSSDDENDNIRLAPLLKQALDEIKVQTSCVDTIGLSILPVQPRYSPQPVIIADSFLFPIDEAQNDPKAQFMRTKTFLAQCDVKNLAQVSRSIQHCISASDEKDEEAEETIAKTAAPIYAWNGSLCDEYISYQACCDYHAGDEIFNNYGTKSQDELLFGYGFLSTFISNVSPHRTCPYLPLRTDEPLILHVSAQNFLLGGKPATAAETTPGLLQNTLLESTIGSFPLQLAQVAGFISTELASLRQTHSFQLPRDTSSFLTWLRWVSQTNAQFSTTSTLSHYYIMLLRQPHIVSTLQKTLGKNIPATIKAKITQFETMLQSDHVHDSQTKSAMMTAVKRTATTLEAYWNNPVFFLSPPSSQGVSRTILHCVHFIMHKLMALEYNRPVFSLSSSTDQIVSDDNTTQTPQSLLDTITTFIPKTYSQQLHCVASLFPGLFSRHAQYIIRELQLAHDLLFTSNPVDKAYAMYRADFSFVIASIKVFFAIQRLSLLSFLNQLCQCMMLSQPNRHWDHQQRQQIAQSLSSLPHHATLTPSHAFAKWKSLLLAADPTHSACCHAIISKHDGLWYIPSISPETSNNTITNANASSLQFPSVSLQIPLRLGLVYSTNPNVHQLTSVHIDQQSISSFIRTYPQFARLFNAVGKQINDDQNMTTSSFITIFPSLDKVIHQCDMLVQRAISGIDPIISLSLLVLHLGQRLAVTIALYTLPTNQHNISPQHYSFACLWYHILSILLPKIVVSSLPQSSSSQSQGQLSSTSNENTFISIFDTGIKPILDSDVTNAPQQLENSASSSSSSATTIDTPYSYSLEQESSMKTLLPSLLTTCLEEQSPLSSQSDSWLSREQFFGEINDSDILDKCFDLVHHLRCAVHIETAQGQAPTAELSQEESALESSIISILLVPLPFSLQPQLPNIPNIEQCSNIDQQQQQPAQQHSLPGSLFTNHDMVIYDSNIVQSYATVIGDTFTVSIPQQDQAIQSCDQNDITNISMQHKTATTTTATTPIIYSPLSTVLESRFSSFQSLSNLHDSILGLDAAAIPVQLVTPSSASTTTPTSSSTSLQDYFAHWFDVIKQLFSPADLFDIKHTTTSSFYDHLNSLARVDELTDFSVDTSHDEVTFPVPYIGEHSDRIGRFNIRLIIHQFFQAMVRLNSPNTTSTMQSFTLHFHQPTSSSSSSSTSAIPISLHIPSIPSSSTTIPTASFVSSILSLANIVQLTHPSTAVCSQLQNQPSAYDMYSHLDASITPVSILPRYISLLAQGYDFPVIYNLLQQVALLSHSHNTAGKHRPFTQPFIFIPTLQYSYNLDEKTPFTSSCPYIPDNIIALFLLITNIAAHKYHTDSSEDDDEQVDLDAIFGTSEIISPISNNNAPQSSSLSNDNDDNLPPALSQAMTLAEKMFPFAYQFAETEQFKSYLLPQIPTRYELIQFCQHYLLSDDQIHLLAQSYIACVEARSNAMHCLQILFFPTGEHSDNDSLDDITIQQDSQGHPQLHLNSHSSPQLTNLSPSSSFRTFISQAWSGVWRFCLQRELNKSAQSLSSACQRLFASCGISLHQSNNPTTVLHLLLEQSLDLQSSIDRRAVFDLLLFAGQVSNFSQMLGSSTVVVTAEDSIL